MIVDATGVPHSCGDFDSAIEYLEAGRSANERLRDIACVALEQVAKMEDDVHGYKQHIEDLRIIIEDRDLTIKNLQQE